MNLKSINKIERPREKLLKYGPDKLSTHELISIILGSGVKGMNVVELSKRVEKLIVEKGLNNISNDDLLNIKGLGKVKSLQILSIIHLSKRLEDVQKAEILSAKDVWTLCADFRDSRKEHVIAFYLNTQNRLIERQIISIGTLDSSLLHPREVFEPAIKLSAASIVLAHNHPSGSTIPSKEDKQITEILVKAGSILGISIQDHVIITANKYFSYKDIGCVVNDNVTE